MRQMSYILTITDHNNRVRQVISNNLNYLHRLKKSYQIKNYNTSLRIRNNYQERQLQRA